MIGGCLEMTSPRPTTALKLAGWRRTILPMPRGPRCWTYVDATIREAREDEAQNLLEPSSGPSPRIRYFGSTRVLG